MKKLLFLAAALSAACAASAQGYYTDAYNPDITRHTGRIAAQRAEFIPVSYTHLTLPTIA